MLSTGTQLLITLINLGLLILVPYILYRIVKAAVRDGINESKLVSPPEKQE